MLHGHIGCFCLLYGEGLGAFVFCSRSEVRRLSSAQNTIILIAPSLIIIIIIANILVALFDLSGGHDDDHQKFTFVKVL